MQMNIMVRYRWAFFVASYILGHLWGVKAQLSSLLAGHDCTINVGKSGVENKGNPKGLHLKKSLTMQLKIGMGKLCVVKRSALL